MATTILRLPAVRARVGLGRTTIYEKMARGEFPKPVSLGARAVGWVEQDVEDWVASRVGRSRPSPVSSHDSEGTG